MTVVKTPVKPTTGKPSGKSFKNSRWRSYLLYVLFLQKGIIINGYVEFLEKLIRRIRRKRQNLEEEGVFFFPDNALQTFQNFLQRQGTGLDPSNSTSIALSLFQVTIIYSRNLRDT
jgi:hypothetical protein